MLAGADDVLEGFERVAPFAREKVDEYAAHLRETNAITEIERAYGDLIALLRREVRPLPAPSNAGD